MRGKAQGMIKDALIVEKRIYRDRWKEKKNFSISQIAFPTMSGRHDTLLNQVVLHDSTGVALHYSILLVQ
jgi:hypothetical protein